MRGSVARMGHLRIALAALAAAAILAPAAQAAPHGYVRVESPDIAAPPTPFDFGGRADCPPGTVVWSGGVGGTSDFGMDINSSNPTGSGWEGRYNNRSSHSGAFDVEAICAAQPRRYVQTFALAANPAGTQATATATCPARTVVLGGGAQSSSDDGRAFLLSAYPATTKTYTAVIWNGSPRDEQLAVYAICGKRPLGYELNASTGSGTGPAELTGGGHCTLLGKVVIGGGVRIANPQPLISIATSFADEDTQWLTNVDVQTGGVQTTTIYSICAA
jgi:hypothetical protein